MLEIFLYLLIFIFGLIVGSFLNCVIYRLEVDESPLSGSSYCPKCKHILRWYDLIPVLSFFILKGKCRYCQKPISLQYPLVEIFTGLLFVSVIEILNFEFVWNLGFGIWNFLRIFYYLFIVSFLIIIFVYDLKHYIIPDKIVYSAIVIAFLYQLFGVWNFGNWNLFEIWNLGFGILPSFFFLAIILFSQGRWMGLGDFKLAILMGLILGFPNILIALFFAFFIGAIIGVGLILFKKKTLKSEVPFAPFLIIGTFFALFWGENFIDWYWHLSLFLLK